MNKKIKERMKDFPLIFHRYIMLFLKQKSNREIKMCLYFLFNATTSVVCIISRTIRGGKAHSTQNLDTNRFSLHKTCPSRSLFCM